MSLRGMAVLAAGVYLAMLHVVLATLIFKTDFPVWAGKTFGLLPPEEWNESLYQGILTLAERNRRVRPGSVVLIGDSLVAQLDPRLIGPDTVNLGLGGETIVTLRRHLPVLTALEAAREIVLLVGVNDFRFRNEPQIATDYAALLRELPHHVPVLAVSILPVDERAEKMRERPYLRNQRFRVVNANIQQLCTDRRDCRFLDAWPAMTGGDATGGTTAALLSADGLHLGPEGERVLGGLISAGLLGK